MANCKDCIHYNVCCELMAQLHWKPELCRSFKDRNRFVELPCGIGDTVYYITGLSRKIIKSAIVKEIRLSCNGLILSVENDTVIFDDFIDTFYFTPEEAEQALKESENND